MDETTQEYQEWKKKRDKYVDSYYSIRVSCNNCHSESHIETKKGTWIWWVLLTTDRKCSKCGLSSWSEHLFQ